MLVDEERREQYQQAYQAWQEQLQHLHRVFLEGERLEPPKLKGLLNREANAKDRYDATRRTLLRLE